MANRQSWTGWLLTACLVSGGAYGADFTIDTEADGVDADPGDGVCATADGTCSLRAAIQETNALAGADRIQVPPGTYNLSLTGADEERAASGDLDITDDLRLIGAGLGEVFVDGLEQDRILDVKAGAEAEVTAGAEVTVEGMTLRGGRPPDNSNGGGVTNAGQLTLVGVAVVRNHAAGHGGGIYNSFGTLTLEDSVVRTNGTTGNGAGIANSNGAVRLVATTVADNNGGQFPGPIAGGGISNFGDLEVVRSTISGHEVRNDGAGIYHNFGELQLFNSTVSGNRAGRDGGGLFAGAAVTMSAATVADNAVDEGAGGGLYMASDAAVSMTSNLFAGNDGGDCGGDRAALSSTGFNVASDDSCALAASGDQTDIDPQLGALADNGGPTATHALLPGSPAVDAGNAEACPDIDQRGFQRGDSCDSGAFELDAQAPEQPASPPAVDDSTTNDADNTAPVAAEFVLNARAGVATPGMLNGRDADGDPLRYALEDLPEKGQVHLIDADLGAFTYRPDIDASGSDSFTYRVSDEVMASEPARVTVMIQAASSAQVPAGGEAPNNEDELDSPQRPRDSDGDGIVDVMEIGDAAEDDQVLHFQVPAASAEALGLSELADQEVRMAVSGNAKLVAHSNDQSGLPVFSGDHDDWPIDEGHTFPLGRYQVTIVAPDDEAQLVIRWPQGVLPAGLEPRALDRENTWVSLEEADLDTEAGVLSLTLTDNSALDRQPQVGLIRHVVGLALTRALDGADGSGADGDTVSDTNGDNSSDTTTSTGTSATTSTAGDSGGGAWGWGLLVLLAGALGWRRRR